MVLQIPPQQQELVIAWEPLPVEYVLPDDPVENIQQPFLAAALTEALGTADRIQPEMLLASNMGVVANVNQKIVVKAPDWFYVPRVAPVAVGVIRRSYTPYREGEAVAIAMEFLSETDTGEYSLRPIHPFGKFYFYEQILKVPTYVIFDPHQAKLEVRRLEGDRYVLQAPSAEGRFWIPELELFLGVWYGTRLEMAIHWLRWWDAPGNLLPWGFELAEQEHLRAEEEHLRAEEEHLRAEEEHLRAEEEHLRAEEERLRADSTSRELAAERQRSEALAARLRALGIDPG
jgi:Uma2 family endonuclease